MGFLRKEKQVEPKFKEVQQVQQVQSQIEPELPVIKTVPVQVQQFPVQQKEPEKPRQKERWMVVSELPTQKIREVQEDDGTIVHLITVDEALTLILNNEWE